MAGDPGSRTISWLARDGKKGKRGNGGVFIRACSFVMLREGGMELVIPVDHVAAITRSHRYGTLHVHKRHSLFNVLEAIDQVFIRPTTPFAVNVLYEPLPESYRSRDVGHDDNIPLLGENGGVPSVAPGVSPGVNRTAVDPE